MNTLYVIVECIGHLSIDWYLTYIEIGGSIFRYSDRSFVRLRHGAQASGYQFLTWTEYRSWRQAAGQPVHVTEPRGMAGGFSISFSCLEVLHNGSGSERPTIQGARQPIIRDS